MAYDSRQIDQDALRTLIEGSGVRCRVGPQSFIFTCPRCQKKDKLYVHKRTGRSQCFKCGDEFKGRAEYILGELFGRRIDELQELLYGLQVAPGTQLKEPSRYKDIWTDEEELEEELLTLEAGLPEVAWDLEIVDIDHVWARPGLAYLESRGIDLAMAKEYGLRYHPVQERIIFPVKVAGELKGWQARYIRSTEWYSEELGEMRSRPKMLTQGQLGGKCLMFQDRLIGSKHAVMVEGPVDALKCHLLGGNVATMGKGVTQKQLDIIVASGVERLYVGLDEDAADDIMRIAKAMASTDLDCYLLRAPPGCEDLGAATPQAIVEQFKTAPRLLPSHVFSYFRY